MDRNVDDFLSAAYEGWLEEVRQFVAEGMDVNAKNHRNETALMVASDANQTDVVSFLLEAGAEVNVFDNDNWTPVQLAAQVNAVAIVRMLLNHGAEMKSKNHLGWDLLFIARRNENVELIHVVESYFPKSRNGPEQSSTS